MKKEKKRNIRTGPERFVRITSRLFIALSAIVLPALMIIFALAVNLSGTGRIIYAVVGVVMAIVYFVIYGFYAMTVSMGTVIGIEYTEMVVHLTTKRKVFTYDVKMGCVNVKRKGKRYICTFRAQNAQDKFVFWTKAPFTRFSDEQFTENDIRTFYPRFDELEL